MCDLFYYVFFLFLDLLGWKIVFPLKNRWGRTQWKLNTYTQSLFSIYIHGNKVTDTNEQIKKNNKKTVKTTTTTNYGTIVEIRGELWLCIYSQSSTQHKNIECTHLSLYKSHLIISIWEMFPSTSIVTQFWLGWIFMLNTIGHLFLFRFSVVFFSFRFLFFLVAFYLYHKFYGISQKFKPNSKR